MILCTEIVTPAAPTPPAGVAGDLQYNAAGAFGGVPWKYDGSNFVGNYSSGDHDFSYLKKTSGTAWFFDAGSDWLNFDTLVRLGYNRGDGAVLEVYNSTSRAGYFANNSSELRIVADNGDILLMGSAAQESVRVTPGHVKINQSGADVDWHVCKKTSGADALLYDAGNDTFTSTAPWSFDAKPATFTEQSVSGTGAKVINWTAGNHATFTFGAGNASTTFTDPATGVGVFTMLVRQDAVGGRAMTSWDPGITWLTTGGAAPTLASGANAYTLCTFRYLGSGNYLGTYHKAT
jgi:hypothetical protein